MSLDTSRWGWISLALLVGSCQKPIPATLGTPFDLQVGQSATIERDALGLLFRRVVSDSRCPRDVQCVTAGEAYVAIQARASTAQPETLELHLGSGEDASGGADHHGYRIRIIELEPYPVSTAEPDTTGYIGTFLVEKR